MERAFKGGSQIFQIVQYCCKDFVVGRSKFYISLSTTSWGSHQKLCQIRAFLSNSNPTWNSTELELVRVGVDFVFQCHNNNKKNPHLMLIYKQVLQMNNIGEVKNWVSRRCLEGVSNVYNRCLEGVQKVSGTLPIPTLQTNPI